MVKITFDLTDKEQCEITKDLIKNYSHYEGYEPEEREATDVSTHTPTAVVPRKTKNTTVAEANTMMRKLLKELAKESSKQEAIETLEKLFKEKGVKDLRLLSTQEDINTVYETCKEKL